MDTTNLVGCWGHTNESETKHNDVYTLLNYGRRPIPPSKVIVSPDIYLRSGLAS